MNAIVMETVNNIENHLKKERKLNYGMLMGVKPGGFSRIVTQDRCYHVFYSADESKERVFVDVYPGITIEKAYRQMAHSYINEKTSGFKAGRVDIDEDTGEVRIRVETSIVSNPATVKDIRDMEHLAIHISDSFERKLDKLGHGVYFKDDDPDLMSASEKKMELLKKKLAQISGKQSSSMSLSDMLRVLESDNDDDGKTSNANATIKQLDTKCESIPEEDQTSTGEEPNSSVEFSTEEADDSS